MPVAMLEKVYVTCVLDWHVELLTATLAFREGTEKPTGHALQTLAFVAEKEPALQAEQAVVLPLAANVPAAHVLQLVAEDPST